MSPSATAPPRSATPEALLKAHKLGGGATRVVMLKEREQGGTQRPSVSFCGQNVTATAMLVGGGLSLVFAAPAALFRWLYPCGDGRIAASWNETALHHIIQGKQARAAQGEALRRAAALTQEALSAEDVEYTLMDELLAQMRSLRDDLMSATRSIAPRVHSSRGSRDTADSDESAGEDLSDDEDQFDS